VRKRGAHFTKLEGKSEVWGMKTGTMVAVDNKNVKVEKNGHSGEGERQRGHEIVWNDVEGNQTGLAEMNEGRKNHEVRVDEELRKWESVVK
jgi:hypothetical protein